MGSMRNWVLGAAMVAGIAGLGAGTAQAAEVRVIARGPVATALPYAGPGHVLAAGYRVNGRWNRGIGGSVAQRFGVMCALVTDGFTDEGTMAAAEDSAGRLLPEHSQRSCTRRECNPRSQNRDRRHPSLNGCSNAESGIRI